VEARHLRGTAESYDQCRGESGAHPDEVLVLSSPLEVFCVVLRSHQREVTWAWKKYEKEMIKKRGRDEGRRFRTKYMRVQSQNRLGKETVSEGHPNRMNHPSVRVRTRTG
jgi:hypothetical protein